MRCHQHPDHSWHSQSNTFACALTTAAIMGWSHGCIARVITSSDSPSSLKLPFAPPPAQTEIYLAATRNRKPGLAAILSHLQNTELKANELFKLPRTLYWIPMVMCFIQPARHAIDEVITCTPSICATWPSPAIPRPAIPRVWPPVRHRPRQLVLDWREI